MITRAASVLALVCLLADQAHAQTAQELKRLTLEELSQMEISTVLRGPEAASLVPAAVFVITQEDIRRSGLTTLPELLRLAPGLPAERTLTVQGDAYTTRLGERVVATSSMPPFTTTSVVDAPLNGGNMLAVDSRRGQPRCLTRAA